MLARRQRDLFRVVFWFLAARTDPPLLAGLVSPFRPFCPFCSQDVPDELSRVSVVGERKHHAEAVLQSIIENIRLGLRSSIGECSIEGAAGRNTLPPLPRALR